MTETQKGGKNWLAAMTLCWFLGTLGAHRFYTGKTNSAWVMLVMSITCCLAPVSTIWALVDGITLAIGAYKAEGGIELEERIPWFGYLYLAFVALGILAGILYFSVILAFIAAAINTPGSIPPVAP